MRDKSGSGGRNAWASRRLVVAGLLVVALIAAHPGQIEDIAGREQGLEEEIAVVLAAVAVAEARFAGHQVKGERVLGATFPNTTSYSLAVPSTHESVGIAPVPDDPAGHGLDLGVEGVDDLHPGRRKITLSFSLPRGAYGTMLIKRLSL